MTTMSTVPNMHATWRPGRSVPLSGILAPLHRGAGDPTMVLGRYELWWALRTPDGACATWWRVRSIAPGDDIVEIQASGPGASWVLSRFPSFLGAEDDVSGFTAHHDGIAHALRQRQHRDWRVPRTGLVVASLVPSILEQKVTGKQAFAGYRRLVRRYGEAVSFPAEALQAAGASGQRVARLMAPPDAPTWRRIPSWVWLQAGVEPPQSKVVVQACAEAAAVERTADLPLAEAHRRLRSLPGIGVWTAAKVAQTAWGDADAPTFEDYHVAKQVGHAVYGRDIDDAMMAEVLEPYRGHRYRAECLLLAGGWQRPRHGPRMSLPAHLPGAAQPSDH